MDYELARRMWHQLEPIHAESWYAALTAANTELPWPGEPHLVLWHAVNLLGELAELTGPLLGAAFGSGLLPGQSTVGIANVPFPSPRS